jgi:hypothetical protein
MRLFTIMGVSLLAAAGLAACQKKAEPAKTGEAASVTATAPAAPVMLPHRKAGLWTQTIGTSGMNQSMKICFDEDTDAKMAVWGQAMGDNKCSKNAVLPIPGGWKIDSVCEMGEAGTIAATSTVTGDFNSSYSVKVSSTTTGAAMAQANGTHNVEITAKYEGPCPAGMKGGDIQVAGMPAGMTMNLEKMQAMAKAQHGK